MASLLVRHQWILWQVYRDEKLLLIFTGYPGYSLNAFAGFKSLEKKIK
jgi:hypothetical protein